MRTGGCLCGAVRYEVTGPLAPIQLCHCGQCRKAQGSALLTEHIEQALAHDHHTHELERRWAQARTAGTQDKARALDDQIDKTHSAISDACLNALRALEPEAPLAQEAKQLLRRLYPAGVQAITQQTHVEQLASNQSILQDLQSAAWSSTAQRLGLTFRSMRYRMVKHGVDSGPDDD